MTAEGSTTGLRGRVTFNSDIRLVVDRLDRRFGLDALWVFGSQAAGRAARTSDLDLAALFRQRPSMEELLEERQELGELLSKDVDLVDLDSTSPILAMQVLRYGKLLVDRNPSRRVSFAAAAPGRYEDLKIIRREAERELLQRVRSGRP
jgi:predicted nucleotidyltransferase